MILAVNSVDYVSIMPLSVFKSYSKNFVLTHFFLFICLIESFKRNFFYPLFSEVYRRKGFLSVALLLDSCSKKSFNYLKLFPSIDPCGEDFWSSESNFSWKTIENQQISTDLPLNPSWEAAIFANFIQMEELLKLSISKVTTSDHHSFEINQILLHALRFNSKTYYPQLLLNFDEFVISSKGSLTGPVDQFRLRLNSIVEAEQMNFCLIEKSLLH